MNLNEVVCTLSDDRNSDCNQSHIRARHIS